MRIIAALVGCIPGIVSNLLYSSHFAKKQTDKIDVVSVERGSLWQNIDFDSNRMTGEDFRSKEHCLSSIHIELD